MNTKAHRWGDNDKYLGPFTWAKDTNYRPVAVVLSSGDGDEHPGCSLRISGFGRTLIIALPAIIKPWREKVPAPSWDAKTVARLGRDWYWNTNSREFGFSLNSDGLGGSSFLQVFYGRQPPDCDSRVQRQWGCFLPWTEWRHVRHSFYDLAGKLVWTVPERHGYARCEVLDAAEKAVPTATFAFADFDGEQLTATTRIEEREWRHGTGWFRWLAWFRRARVRRSLNIEFSGETGRRKGSWKGGTIGHAIEMLPGELHEAAFRRYCAENNMTFIGPAVPR